MVKTGATHAMTSTDEEFVEDSTPLRLESNERLRSRLMPSPWLMFYSLAPFLGGLYLLTVALAPSNKFVVMTMVFSFTAILTGILLWLRLRIGLICYVILALLIFGFSGFRIFTEGYTTGRLGMVIGGILMLAGFSSIVEEMPLRRP